MNSLATGILGALLACILLAGCTIERGGRGMHWGGHSDRDYHQRY